MRGITIKLPEATLRQLEIEARATGRSVAAIIRERIEAQPDAASSVYSLTRDLAGSVSGGNKAATNERRKFGRT
jgi:predicted DNA-binding protein